MPETIDTELLDRTAGIVAAHVSNNTVSGQQLPTLIQTVHTALSGLGFEPEPEKAPAVSIKRSVQKDAITCLECGLPKKMLKRHLTNAHGLSVTEYRVKWKLPGDYPMTAPNYAAQRSKLAKKIGLGRKPKGRGRRKG
jgi:predicted transcriptional regulator